jgi:hypothetical protein
MKRKINVLILLLLLLAVATTASAAGYGRIINVVVDEDVNVYRNDLLIEEEGRVNGNVTVFSGKVEVIGVIDGNLSVFGGDANVSGTVTGNLVIFGGNLDLAPDARVDGDCFVGGAVRDDSGGASCAEVASGVLQNRPWSPRPPAPVVPAPPAPPAVPVPPVEQMEVPSIEVPRRMTSPLARFFSGVSEAVGRSLLMGILALVVTAVFPRQLQQVGQTVRERPAASGAVGFLTAIAAPSLVALLLVVLAITCIGLLLYPAVFLLALVPLAALLLGWVAVGERFGSWLLRALNRNDASLVTTAALGTALLTLGLGLLTLIPPFSFGGGFGVWIAGLILAAVGLGAAVLTKLGTQTYPPGSPPRGKVESALETLPKGDETP